MKGCGRVSVPVRAVSVGDDGHMSIRRAVVRLLAVEEPVVREVPASAPSQVEEAWRVLDLVNGWVFHAEAKLGVTLAYLGALFAGLIAMLASFKQPSGLILWITAVAVVFLLGGVVFAALGLLPRFGKSKEGRNITYYRDIEGMEYGEYEHAFRTSVVGDGLLPYLTQQIRAISGVAVRKYWYVHTAIIFGVLALITTGVVGLGLLLGW